MITQNAMFDLQKVGENADLITILELNMDANNSMVERISVLVKALKNVKWGFTEIVFILAWDHCDQ